MFIIQAQMIAFRKIAKRNFGKRLAEYFDAGYEGKLSHAGERIPTGSVLEDLIFELITVAESFGLTEELGVGQFVALGLGYSRTFYEIERVAKLLKDPAFTAEQNVQRVLNAVVVAEARAA